MRDGESSQIRAEGEVIVCGGTVESPKLLLLSGIGAADELARLGIGVVADVPGVGRNLHDHLLSPVIHAASRPVPPPLPGLQPLHSHLFAHSRPGCPGRTSSRSSSTCRSTSRAWRARPTATR